MMQRMWSTYLDVATSPHERLDVRWKFVLSWERGLLTTSPSFFFHPARPQYGRWTTLVRKSQSLFLIYKSSFLSSSQSSRPASIANSAYSQAASTRHMLADIPPSDLANPNLPAPGLQLDNTSTGMSLSANYIPHKFSDAMLSGAFRRRKGDVGPKIPKLGGGIEAFRSGEARMPGENDEDYDGVQSGWFGNKNRTTARRMRWTRFKWILFFSNICVYIYISFSLLFVLT